MATRCRSPPPRATGPAGPASSRPPRPPPAATTTSCCSRCRGARTDGSPPSSASPAACRSRASASSPPIPAWCWSLAGVGNGCPKASSTSRPMQPSPRMRRWLDQLLHTHDTPRRTAAAYALGVFFGFSPFLGLHTILGLGFAFALNLNRVAVLLGVYSNLPWILPAYYTLTTLAGAAVLGVQVPPGLLRDLTAAVA